MTTTIVPPLTRAGFGIRLAAALIDTAILVPVFYALTLAADRWLDKSAVWASFTAGNVLVLCYGFLEVVRGATPGKMVLGLRILGEDAAPATFAALLARWALKFGPRICGLLEAATEVQLVRNWAANLGLAIFRQEPLSFVTLRYVGELLLLGVTVGFFLTLGSSRQSLYDRLTRTAVCRRPPTGPAKQGFEPVLPRPPGSAG